MPVSIVINRWGSFQVAEVPKLHFVFYSWFEPTTGCFMAILMNYSSPDKLVYSSSLACFSENDSMLDCECCWLKGTFPKHEVTSYPFYFYYHFYPIYIPIHNFIFHI